MDAWHTVRLAVLSLGLAGGASELASGQRVTVQLPTFRQFSTSTTVVVPDRGGTYIGGMHRALDYRSSSRTPGMLGGHRFGWGSSSTSGVSVRVWVHDLEGMDRAILEQWAAAKPAAHAYAQQNQASLPEPPDPPRKTLRQLRQERQLADQRQQQQAAADFQAGQRSEAQGKVGVAKIYYRMAQRRAAEDLRREISTRLDRLGNATQQISRTSR